MNPQVQNNTKDDTMADELKNLLYMSLSNIGNGKEIADKTARLVARMLDHDPQSQHVLLHHCRN